MKEQLMELLVDPETHEPLELRKGKTDENGDIIEGELKSPSGGTFTIINGIPRFVSDEYEKQTASSFSYKWYRQSAYEDKSVEEMIIHDEIPRWDFEDVEELRDIFRGPKTILDAGCGSAHFASIYAPYVNDTNKLWVGTDLTTAIDLAQERFSKLPNVAFAQGNILQLPFKDESFDTIVCRGVMHHTPDQWGAFRSLVQALKSGGELVYLIYRKMGPIREFTDTHIRKVISQLPPDEGWEALKPLTNLGRSLANMNVTVEVPDDIPYLEIPKGKHDLHGLIYNYFVKAFWSKDQGLMEDSVYDYSMHNTFDWYHPRFASKATKEDILQHAKKNGMELTFCKGSWTSWAVRCLKK